MKIFDDAYGSLEYDPTVPCVVATFVGFMTSDQFRHFLMMGLDLMIEKRPLKGKILWLADTTKHSVQSDRDTKWVAEVWNQKAIDHEIFHVAFVLPENAYGTRSIKKYALNNEKSNEPMIIEFFDALDQAKEWFRNL